MSVKLATLDVEIVGCGSNTPFREFQIPDTGDAAANLKIAELIHLTLLGAPYECTRCSGGDYHFNRSVQFVGPATHRVARTAPVTCGGLKIPVDQNGIPFVALTIAASGQ